jgi:hypothetical protein
MKEDPPFYTIGLVLTVVLGFIVGAWFTANEFKKIAVKRGHAEWVADPEGGVEFHWKEPAK